MTDMMIKSSSMHTEESGIMKQTILQLWILGMISKIVISIQPTGSASVNSTSKLKNTSEIGVLRYIYNNRYEVIMSANSDDIMLSKSTVSFCTSVYNICNCLAGATKSIQTCFGMCVPHSVDLRAYQSGGIIDMTYCEDGVMGCEAHVEGKAMKIGTGDKGMSLELD